MGRKPAQKKGKKGADRHTTKTEKSPANPRMEPPKWAGEAARRKFPKRLEGFPPFA